MGFCAGVKGTRANKVNKVNMQSIILNNTENPVELPEYKFERRHSIDYFYKCMTAATAKNVLFTSKFRNSSPLLFNDPFDNQAGMHTPSLAMPAGKS